jgi:hypothetical protein
MIAVKETHLYHYSVMGNGSSQNHTVRRYFSIKKQQTVLDGNGYPWIFRDEVRESLTNSNFHNSFSQFDYEEEHRLRLSLENWINKKR